MLGRQIEWHTFQAGETRPIMPGVIPLQGRAAETLRAGDLEGGAERERTPQHGSPVPLGQCLDLECGEVGIARRKVEPEFDRCSALLLQRGHPPPHGHLAPS
jgi:hypothetical protein